MTIIHFGLNLSPFIRLFLDYGKLKAKYIYKNRIKKNAAYEKLAEKMKEIDPKVNRDLVRAKINSFRTSYCKKLNKVKSNQKSGAGANDIYKPRLWYFYEIDFFKKPRLNFKELPH